MNYFRANASTCTAQTLNDTAPVKPTAATGVTDCTTTGTAATVASTVTNCKDKTVGGLMTSTLGAWTNGTTSANGKLVYQFKWEATAASTTAAADRLWNIRKNTKLGTIKAQYKKDASNIDTIILNAQLINYACTVTSDNAACSYVTACTTCATCTTCKTCKTCTGAQALVALGAALALSGAF